MKILVIEDDDKTAGFVLKALKESGYSTIHAKDGNEGYRFATLHSIDLAIIDLMLPGINGLTVIENIRKHNLSFPIIVLSAKDSTQDKVNALMSGCDIYLSKPFSISELLANIHAQIRRTYMLTEPSSLTVKDLTIDLLSRKVQRNGNEIILPPREYALLEYLMRNAGRVVTKTMIIEHVWEYNFDPQTSVVETRIHQLRKKIDESFEEPLIHTLRGVGYILE
ncbi:MAG: response regulator transcription factor [Lentisphaeria bacterium]|nr:response regulator transcription factor [Lentisphaeria bacterium]